MFTTGLKAYLERRRQKRDVKALVGMIFDGVNEVVQSFMETRADPAFDAASELHQERALRAAEHSLSRLSEELVAFFELMCELRDRLYLEAEGEVTPAGWTREAVAGEHYRKVMKDHLEAAALKRSRMALQYSAELSRDLPSTPEDDQAHPHQHAAFDRLLGPIPGTEALGRSA